MKKNIIDRQKLMNRAWAMHRETRDNMSVCLKRAWELVRLGKALVDGEATIRYYKLDGTLRIARATLSAERGARIESKGVRKESPKVFTYWDKGADGIRSFRVENLISWSL